MSSGGVRLVGLDAISKFTGAVLPGAFSDRSTVTYEVVDVSFLADDVVLTSVDERYYDAGGEAVSGGRPTYVWRFRDGTCLMLGADGSSETWKPELREMRQTREIL